MPEGTGLGTTPHFPVPVGGIRASNDSGVVDVLDEGEDEVEEVDVVWP